jgi:hypothetical protein
LLAVVMLAVAVIVALTIALVPASQPEAPTIAHTTTAGDAEAMPLAVDAAVAAADAEIAIAVDAAVRPEPIVDAQDDEPPRRSRTIRPSPQRSRPATAAVSADRAPGFLTVDSRPTASISIDGRALGQVPLYRVELAPGSYRMVAKLEDGRTKTVQIVIRSGEDVRKRVTW